MSQTSTVPASHFLCGGCGKRHPWKSALAGKKGRCKCGFAMTVPDAPAANAPVANAPVVDVPKPKPSFAAPTIVTPGQIPVLARTAAEEPLYDIVDAPAAPTKRKRPIPVVADEAPAEEVPSAPVEPARPFIPPSHKPLGLEPEEPGRAPSVFRDVIAPVVLIAAGVALCLLDGTYKGAEDGWVPLSTVAASVAIQIVASLALVVGAVFAASAVAGIAFTERVWMTIIKLCAVALAPAAVGSLADHYVGGINGNIAAAFVAVAMYALLLWYLVKLTTQDYVICVALIWIIRTFVLYLMFRLKGAASGSAI